MQFIFSIIRIYVRNTVPRLYLKFFQQGYGISTAICKAAIAPLLCSRPSTGLACPQILHSFSRNLNLESSAPFCSMHRNCIENLKICGCKISCSEILGLPGTMAHMLMHIFERIKSGICKKQVMSVLLMA